MRRSKMTGIDSFSTFLRAMTETDRRQEVYNALENLVDTLRSDKNDPAYMAKYQAALVRADKALRT
jgi:hypothetical protein